jgi:putative ABC transport system permease protein
VILLRFPIAVALLVYQSAVLAFGQIWANKVRGILTTIGIMIGVASVTAVISVIKGLETQVMSKFEAFGTNKMFAYPERGRSERKHFTQYIPFPRDIFNGVLDHCPSIDKYSLVTWLGGQVSYRDRSEEAQIAGIEPTWHEIERRTVIIGRPFSMIDNAQLRLVCLVNEVCRDKLGLDRDPTGVFISVGAQRFMIIGVVEKAINMGGNEQGSAEVFVPYNTAMATRERGTFFLAMSKSADVSEDARVELTFFLRQRRHLKPADPDNFAVMIATRYIEEIQKTSMVVTTIALGVVGISLLVGGVGIMNIMLVSVSERTREIGLRKAVGARSSAILLQFLVEAVMLCLLGGVVGLLAGQGITSIIVSFIPKEAEVTRIIVPPLAIVLALTFSGSVGLVFGMFPAIKAARLDPIEALRHE